MTKILLIEPAKILADTKRGMKNLSYYINPSLGLLSIGSISRKEGFDVTYFSPNLDFEDWKIKLQKIVKKRQFDFVAISNTASTIESDMEIALFIRKNLPSIKMVTGGYYSHLYPRTILKHTEIDIVVRGDGELPFLEILKGLKKIEKIPGVCFKYLKDGKEKYFIQKPYFMNKKGMSKIPPIDFSLYNYQRAWEKWPAKITKNQISIYTSRGCPFSCRFCSVPFFNNHKLRFLPLETSAENITRAGKLGPKRIFITDPNFNANKKYCETICDLIIELKKKKRISKQITFAAQGRIDLLDKELLAKMSLAGFRYLWLGIENISPRVLKEDINKSNWLGKEEILKRLKLIARFGIRPGIYLIFGLPTITMKEITENVIFAKSLRELGCLVEINPFVSIYPETEYYHLYKNTSYISWEKIIFKRLINNREIPFKIRIPLFVWPKDKDVKTYLSNLWRKTTKITQEKGVSFAYTFINEAIKTLCKGIT